MRKKILLVSQDLVARGRLSQLIKASGYSVEIADNVEHVRRIQLKNIVLSILISAGNSVDELRIATGKPVLTFGTVGSVQPAFRTQHAADEAALLAQIHELLNLPPEVDEPDWCYSLPTIVLTSAVEA